MRTILLVSLLAIFTQVQAQDITTGKADAYMYTACYVTMLHATAQTEFPIKAVFKSASNDYYDLMDEAHVQQFSNEIGSRLASGDMSKEELILAAQICIQYLS